jgi:hypothetical protein
MDSQKKAQQTATKIALNQGFDGARLIKKDDETLVFICYFNRDNPNEIPDTGKPLFIEITGEKINYYSGF